MKSSHRANKIALFLTLVGVYQWIVLADLLDWPFGVKFGLGWLGLLTLIGTKVALTDWGEWRADRARLRQERSRRRAQA
jgi:hypothetical protein